MAIQDAVNLYALLLGLPKDVTEPNYYQILGLPAFTDDATAIRGAAAAQNGKLLKWQNSDYFKSSMKLAFEIVEALRVLENPEFKREYDDELKRRRAVLETQDIGDEKTINAMLGEIKAADQPGDPQLFEGTEKSDRLNLLLIMGWLTVAAVSFLLVVFVVNRQDSRAERNKKAAAKTEEPTTKSLNRSAAEIRNAARKIVPRKTQEKPAEKKGEAQKQAATETLKPTEAAKTPSAKDNTTEKLSKEEAAAEAVRLRDEAKKLLEENDDVKAALALHEQAATLPGQSLDYGAVRDLYARTMQWEEALEAYLKSAGSTNWRTVLLLYENGRFDEYRTARRYLQLVDYMNHPSDWKTYEYSRTSNVLPAEPDLYEPLRLQAVANSNPQNYKSTRYGLVGQIMYRTREFSEWYGNLPKDSPMRIRAHAALVFTTFQRNRSAENRKSVEEAIAVLERSASRLIEDGVIRKGHWHVYICPKAWAREGCRVLGIKDPDFPPPTISSLPAVDRSLYMNGISKIVIPTPYLIGQDAKAVTFEGWVRPFDVKHMWISYAQGFHLKTSSNRWQFGFIYDAGTPSGEKAVGYHMTNAPQIASAGKIVHIAGVYDGKTLRLYMDGEKVSERKVTEVPSDDPGNWLGLTLIGELDELRFSSIARYDQDFTPQRRFEPDAETIALYHCDEGQGIRLVDSSGNGHHGLIVSGEVKWVQWMFEARLPGETSQVEQLMDAEILKARAASNANPDDAKLAARWGQLLQAQLQLAKAISAEKGVEAWAEYRAFLSDQVSRHIVEPGWRLTRTVAFPRGQAAHYNVRDRLLYVLRRISTNAEEPDGLYRIEADGTSTQVATANHPGGIVIDPKDGDVFFSEPERGGIYRWGFGDKGRSLWVAGFHDGDDDPVGMAVAPLDYQGKIVSPGEILVTDCGYAGPDGVWRFNADIAEQEMEVVGDNSPLVNALDVTIGRNGIYIADTGEKAAGQIFRLIAKDVVVPLKTSQSIPHPVGITTDPITGDLFVLERSRLLRVKPVTGEVSEVVTKLRGTGYAGVDTTPDGNQLFITDTEAGVIYTLSRSKSKER